MDGNNLNRKYVETEVRMHDGAHRGTNRTKTLKGKKLNVAPNVAVSTETKLGQVVNLFC